MEQINQTGQSNSGQTHKPKPKWRSQQIQHKKNRRATAFRNPENVHEAAYNGTNSDLRTTYRLPRKGVPDDGHRSKTKVPAMFSQPSVMMTGDKGVFVTCDKGREKQCLRDLADLIEEHLEAIGLIPDEDFNLRTGSEAARHQQNTASNDSDTEGEDIDIESSIRRELSGMQGSDSRSKAPTKANVFQLITLDIPCVSFLRFLPGNPVIEQVDVVELVHSICARAAREPGQMRSRYIKRLSPITWMGKVLSGGFARACEEVLPAHFTVRTLEDVAVAAPESHVSSTQNSKEYGVTFAIKPTTRNNDKLSRDNVIKQIADEVQRLGHNKHKVDLKGYQKGILVEVYRGWIGMSVVDNLLADTSYHEYLEGDQGDRLGYEALKRFNLSEIYAEGVKQLEATGLE